jgi:hypothetical protein
VGKSKNFYRTLLWMPGPILNGRRVIIKEIYGWKTEIPTEAGID